MVKKDNIRDYAVEAFRKYALLGKPTIDELKGRIMRSATSEAQALCSVNRCIPLIADIGAVNDTLAKLEEDNKQHIIKAIEAVYFVCPKSPTKKKEIYDRAVSFGVTYGASERTVFYWLKEARSMFSDFRGLDNGEKNLKSLQ